MKIWLLLKLIIIMIINNKNNSKMVAPCLSAAALALKSFGDQSAIQFEWFFLWQEIRIVLPNCYKTISLYWIWWYLAREEPLIKLFWKVCVALDCFGWKCQQQKCWWVVWRVGDRLKSLKVLGVLGGGSSLCSREVSFQHRVSSEVEAVWLKEETKQTWRVNN